MKYAKAVVVMCVCIATLALTLSLPTVAFGLEVERWTAKPNQETGNNIMGAVDTRTTFQGQCSETESLLEVVIDLPEGSVFAVENVAVTVMDGLDRLPDFVSTVETEGTSGIKVVFAEETPAGSLVMIEIPNMQFPAEGGSYDLVGTYTTGDGKTQDLPDAKGAIVVEAGTDGNPVADFLAGQEWVQAWNANKFLHTFLDPVSAAKAIPTVFNGWLLALGLVVVSFPLAIPLGLFWSFMRMAKNRLLRGIGSLYINIVRGTPLFLQIYIAFFGLPLLGISLDGFVLAIIVLMMNSSAYLAEIFRAGIQSISKGQFEAARSLGMNAPQTMFSVIIPQTIRRVIPTMTSEFILMYKDTSLLAAVGVMEIMMFSKVITAATGNMTPYIVAAGFYLIVTLPLTKLINILEERMAERDAGTLKRKTKKNAPKRAEGGSNE